MIPLPRRGWFGVARLTDETHLAGTSVIRSPQPEADSDAQPFNEDSRNRRAAQVLRWHSEI